MNSLLGEKVSSDVVNRFGLVINTSEYNDWKKTLGLNQSAQN